MWKARWLILYVMMLSLLEYTCMWIVNSEHIQQNRSFPSRYQDWSTCNPLALVGKWKSGDNGKKRYGYIDINGDVVIPLIFERAQPFKEGIAWVQYGRKAYFINALGNIIYSFKGRNIFHYPFDVPLWSEGLVSFTIRDKRGEKGGFHDIRGQIVIPPRFNLVTEFFQEGLTIIEIDGKKGAINRRGELVIEPKYDYLSHFFNGIAVAGEKIDGKWKYGYINTKGEWIIPPIFYYAQHFSEGLGYVEMSKLDEKGFERKEWIGFINSKGNIVYRLDPEQYECWLCTYRENFVLFVKMEDGKRKGYVFFDHTGRIVFTIDYEQVDPFSEGLARVVIQVPENMIFVTQYNIPGSFSKMVRMIQYERKEKEKPLWGFIDKSGQLAFQPIVFDYVGWFQSGRAVVGIAKRYGYIDRRGRVVVPLIYDEVYDFSSREDTCVMK